MAGPPPPPPRRLRRSSRSLCRSRRSRGRLPRRRGRLVGLRLGTSHSQGAPGGAWSGDQAITQALEGGAAGPPAAATAEPIAAGVPLDGHLPPPRAPAPAGEVRTGMWPGRARRWADADRSLLRLLRSARRLRQGARATPAVGTALGGWGDTQRTAQRPSDRAALRVVPMRDRKALLNRLASAIGFGNWINDWLAAGQPEVHFREEVHWFRTNPLRSRSLRAADAGCAGPHTIGRARRA